MARSLGIVKTSLWRDDDFRALPRDAQRAYVLLISQPQITNCGVLPWTPRKWAKLALDDTPAAMAAALRVLEETRFVVVDEDTEELVIRTFVRHDRIEAQPRLLAAAEREFYEIESAKIRKMLRDENPQVFGSMSEPRPLGQGVLEGVAEGVGQGVAEGVNARARGPADAPSPSPTPAPSPAEDVLLEAEAAGRASEKSLPFEKQRLIVKLLSELGEDADEGTPVVVRSLAERLPEGSLVKVLESVQAAKPRNRAAYAVGAMKQEIASLNGASSETDEQRQARIDAESEAEIAAEMEAT